MDKILIWAPVVSGLGQTVYTIKTENRLIHNWKPLTAGAFGVTGIATVGACIIARSESKKDPSSLAGVIKIIPGLYCGYFLAVFWGTAFSAKALYIVARSK